jgi:hypothetical protein
MDSKYWKIQYRTQTPFLIGRCLHIALSTFLNNSILQYVLKLYDEYSETEIFSALDPLAILRKINVNFMMSTTLSACTSSFFHKSVRSCVCSSYPSSRCPPNTLRLPLDGFGAKSVERKYWLSWTEVTDTYMKTCVSYILFDSFLLRLREVQDEDCRKKSQHIIPVIYNLFLKVISNIIIFKIIYI